MKTTAMFAAAIMIGAAGCATPQQAAVAPPPPLFCKVKDECELFWRRAQVWLAQNSSYRIQSATDTVISTHGPRRYSVDRAYRITRVPGPNGIDQILFESGCANLFGCSTNRFDDEVSFKRYVRGEP